MTPVSDSQAIKKSEKGVSREVEEEIFGESLEVIRGIQMFWKVFGEEWAGESEPPDDWVDEYGLEKARKFFKLAKAGLLGRQEAPIGIQAAMGHAQSVLRSRAAEEAGPKTLSIGTLVQMPAPAALYPSREVDDEG